MIMIDAPRRLNLAPCLGILEILPSSRVALADEQSCPRISIARSTMVVFSCASSQGPRRTQIGAVSVMRIITDMITYNKKKKKKIVEDRLASALIPPQLPPP